MARRVVLHDRHAVHRGVRLIDVGADAGRWGSCCPSRDLGLSVGGDCWCVDGLRCWVLCVGVGAVGDGADSVLALVQVRLCWC